MSINSSSGVNDSQSTSQGQSQGSGQSTNASQSQSYIPDQEPQLGFLEQFGNTAGQLAGQQYDWANNQFQNNQNLTDSNVNNYLQNSDMAGQASQRDYQNYNDIFNPAASSLTQDWQSYTSPGRVASEMGRSEANVAQNAESQRANTERSLRSYGVNPSDPRYAGAMAASRTAQAAAEAGAGTQARLNTEATGRGLRTQALNEAHLLPGQQATEQNVSMQGVTGAQNAAMANTSEGALTLGTTPNYLNSGINDIKFSPLGTSSSSAGQSTNQNSAANASQSTSHGQNASSGMSAGGGGGSGSGSGSPSTSGTIGPRQSPGPGTSGSAGQANNGTSSNGAGTQHIPGSAQQNDPNATDPNTGLPYDPNNSGIDPGTGQYGPDPWNGSWDGGSTQTGTTDPNQAPGWDPSQMTSGVSGIGDWSGGNALGNSTWSGAGLDQVNNQGYARGGAIPDGGGMVPRHMSPSGGHQTDDIPAVINQTGGTARLNADEFVIPQDVVQWMGHKFFQDLIMKSRKARMANPGPAHATMGPGGESHDAGGTVDPGSNSAGFQSSQTTGTEMTGGVQMHDPGPQQQGGFDYTNALAAENNHHGLWTPDDPGYADHQQLGQAQWVANSQNRFLGTNNDPSTAGGLQSANALQQQRHPGQATTQPRQASNGGGQSAGGISGPGSPTGGVQMRDPGPGSPTGGVQMRDPGMTRTQHVASALPTMSNYQAGNRDQAFHAQPNYFTRAPQAPAAGIPQWQDVHRPAAPQQPQAPVQSRPAPQQSAQQPAQQAAPQQAAPQTPSTPTTQTYGSGGSSSPNGWTIQNGRWVQTATDQAQNTGASETLGGTGHSGISFNGLSTDRPGGATMQLPSVNTSRGAASAAPQQQVMSNIQMVNGIPIDPHSGSMGGGIFTHLRQGGAVPGRRRPARAILD